MLKHEIRRLKEEDLLKERSRQKRIEVKYYFNWCLVTTQRQDHLKSKRSFVSA